MTDELPEGWKWATLGDGFVVDIQPGFACGINNRSGEGIPHLRPMNVTQDGQISLVDLKSVPESSVHKDEQWIRKGDILFNNTNSPELVGKTAFYDLSEPRAFSNHMTRIRTNPASLDPRFCAAYLHQLWRDGQFEAICNNHVSQASISRAVLSATLIPLPPLAEQKRIVSKVEQVVASVNDARKRLNRVAAILKAFRRSVVVAACSGSLTHTWRHEGNAFAPLGLLELDANNLPSRWTWRSLRELGHLGRGKSRHRPRDASHLYGGPYPFIQTGDVARSGGLIKTYRQTYSEAGLRQSELWPINTVCITIAANIADSGVLAFPACFPDSVVGFIANEAMCLPDFVELFIRTARADLSRLAPATAQKNINLAALHDVRIPLPPLEEQNEIVRRVKALFAIATSAEGLFGAAADHADALVKTVLSKAFKGDLP